MGARRETQRDRDALHWRLQDLQLAVSVCMSVCAPCNGGFTPARCSLRLAPPATHPPTPPLHHETALSMQADQGAHARRQLAAADEAVRELEGRLAALRRDRNELELQVGGR